MSIDDKLGFTKEQLDQFTSDLDPDLRTKIEVAYEAGDADGVSVAMGEADVHMAHRKTILARQRYLH